MLKMEGAAGTQIHIYSKDVLEAAPSFTRADWKSYYQHLLCAVAINPIHEELLFSRLPAGQVASVRFLVAHAGDENEQWIFEDKDKLVPMQRWVTANDGKAHALFINACNVGNREIVSTQSLVFHPTEIASLDDILYGRATMRAYIPDQGYLDTLP